MSTGENTGRLLLATKKEYPMTNEKWDMRYDKYSVWGTKRLFATNPRVHRLKFVSLARVSLAWVLVGRRLMPAPETALALEAPNSK